MPAKTASKARHQANTKPPDVDGGSSDDDQSSVADNEMTDSETSRKRKVNKPNEKTRKQRKSPPTPPPEDSIPVEATDVPPRVDLERNHLPFMYRS